MERYRPFQHIGWLMILLWCQGDDNKTYDTSWSSNNHKCTRYVWGTMWGNSSTGCMMSCGLWEVVFRMKTEAASLSFEIPTCLDASFDFPPDQIILFERSTIAPYRTSFCFPSAGIELLTYMTLAIFPVIAPIVSASPPRFIPFKIASLKLFVFKIDQSEHSGEYSAPMPK